MPTPTKPQPSPFRLPPLSIIRMIWKRRWLALICWIVASAASLAVVRMLPSIYQSQAIVLVDSQKIPENFVTSTVNGDVADRLALISQDIMSSSRLLEIIRAYDLYKTERRTNTQEEILRQMHNDISISVEKSWTGGRMQAFRLGYQGRDPKVVTEVTNRLAGLYVAENARARESQAEGTVVFLRKQLAESKKSLSAQETKVTQFKQEHNGTLPQQENSLLSSLSSLRVELQGVQDGINRSQENKVSLEASLAAAESSEAGLEASLQPGHKSSSAPVTEWSNSESKTQSEVLEEQLRGLRLRYTDDYPEVQAKEKEIRDAKRQEAEQAAKLGQVLAARAASSDASQQGKASENQRAIPVTPEVLRGRERIVSLRGQIAVIARQIGSLEKRRQDLTAQTADYEARLNKLPLVEQEMAALKRDYDESANNYNSLLQKELAADMATDMERSKNSERFTVIDPARVPQKPVKPKRAVLAAVGSLGGLALGLIFGFALEFRKQSFLGEWELPPGAVVLGRVPQIKLLASSATVTTPLLLIAALSGALSGGLDRYWS